MFLKIFIVLSSHFFFFSLFAHGEDKAGPHGGKILMPGAYHVEVMKSESSKIVMVYLLDMFFKNPSTKNSSVKILKSAKDKKVLQTCVVKGDGFECKLDAVSGKDQENIVIQSQREGLSGALILLSSLKLI